MRRGSSDTEYLGTLGFAVFYCLTVCDFVCVCVLLTSSLHLPQIGTGFKDEDLEQHYKFLKVQRVCVCVSVWGRVCVSVWGRVCVCVCLSGVCQCV